MQCSLNPTVNRANGNVLRIKPWLVLTTVKDWTFTSKQRKMGNTAEERWLRLKGHICHTAEAWITAGYESLLFVFVFKRHIQMAKLQFFLPQRKKFRLKLKLKRALLEHKKIKYWLWWFRKSTDCIHVKAVARSKSWAYQWYWWVVYAEPKRY